MNITSDGAADIRDLTLSGPDQRMLGESSPIYSSKDSMMDCEDPGRHVGSMFNNNESLVDMLERRPPAPSSVVVVEEDQSKGAPLSNPYASFTDGSPLDDLAGNADTSASDHQGTSQLDDNTYEQVSVYTEK